MKYGYFDNENREYVITRPDVPAPWTNYLVQKNSVPLSRITQVAIRSTTLQNTTVLLSSVQMRHSIAQDTTFTYVMMRREITGQSLGNQLPKA